MSNAPAAKAGNRVWQWMGRPGWLHGSSVQRATTSPCLGRRLLGSRRAVPALGGSFEPASTETSHGTESPHDARPLFPEAGWSFETKIHPDIGASVAINFACANMYCLELTRYRAKAQDGKLPANWTRGRAFGARPLVVGSWVSEAMEQPVMSGLHPTHRPVTR